MGTTVTIVCYRNKILSNGKSPLMLRICKDRKTKYQSLGISVDPDCWDFKKNKPKLSCPDKELIQKIILDKEVEYQKQILDTIKRYCQINLLAKFGSNAL
jgi:predicted type IV restriction endonuclease